MTAATSALPLTQPPPHAWGEGYCRTEPGTHHELMFFADLKLRPGYPSQRDKNPLPSQWERAG